MNQSAPVKFIVVRYQDFPVHKFYVFSCIDNTSFSTTSATTFCKKSETKKIKAVVLAWASQVRLTHSWWSYTFDKTEDVIIPLYSHYIFMYSIVMITFFIILRIDTSLCHSGTNFLWKVYSLVYRSISKIFL